MIKRFIKVNSKLYRGGAPTIEDVVFLNKVLGINKIVSLDYSAGKHISRVCDLLKIKHIMIPIDVFNKSSILKLFKYDLWDLLMKDGPTFVHCVEGKDRTGLVISMFKCKFEGWSYEKAIKEAEKLGFGKGVDPSVIDLYKKIIKKCCKSTDENSAYDIMSNVKDLQGEYRDYNLDSTQEPSFAPYQDYRIREWPFADTNKYVPEQYETRNDYGLDDILDMDIGDNTVPSVGQLDQNTNGMSGAGPSFVGSGFI